MSVEGLERRFREKVAEQIRLRREGVNRYRVFTPFLFEDGDHLVIVLKKEGPRWVLSDEAHTYMRLAHCLDERDPRAGTRQQVITNTLSSFRIDDRNGELVLPVPDDRFGDALYSFVQAILNISDVAYLTREAEAAPDGMPGGRRP